MMSFKSRFSASHAILLVCSRIHLQNMLMMMLQPSERVRSVYGIFMQKNEAKSERKKHLSAGK
jgi:hypothetical protein